MADIRINSLPTTASASSSDDFLALDGATNGTRKLNAFSPTFGGNLTVSGAAGLLMQGAAIGATAAGEVGMNYNNSATGSLVFYGGGVTPKFTVTNAGNLTVSGTAITLSNTNSISLNLRGGAPGSSSAGIVLGTNASDIWTIGRGVVSGGNTMEFYASTGTPGTRFSIVDTTGNATLAGNLTVSGTGTSSVAGPLTISSTNGNLLNITSSGSGDAYAQWNNSTPVQAGYGVTTGRAFGGTLSNHAFDIRILNVAVATFATTGNLLIGTTTDSGNGKLQLATHTTSAGGIGFGTSTSLFTDTARLVLVGGTTTRFRLLSTGGNAADFQFDNSELAIGNSSSIRFYTTATALTLDSSQNATFAGDIRFSLANTFDIGQTGTRVRNAFIRTLVLTSGAPAAANSTGTAGTVTWDANYLYVCTATDTWKRVAIATWP